MPDILIHNETDYDLLPWMIDRIKTEAIEYFGESLYAIRIQLGITRHAFNPKTHEVRYAFYPSDYGLSYLPELSDESKRQEVDRLHFPDVEHAHITSDLIDESAEVDTDFDVIDDVDVLDNDDVEFAGLDPDFDALDPSDPELFL